jgi:cysteine desulfurase/selenocysteine lyase
LDDKFIYAEIPHRFEGGTPNVSGIIGWGQAIDYLNELGWDNIKKHDLELCSYAKKEFSKLKNIIHLNPYAKIPIILFNIKEVYAQDVTSYLGNHKIIVRSGLSCARLAHKIIDTRAAIRASLYIYNTKEDIDKLVSILKRFKKGDELRHVI